jgi:hypothetical protein
VSCSRLTEFAASLSLSMHLSPRRSLKTCLILNSWLFERMFARVAFCRVVCSCSEGKSCCTHGETKGPAITHLWMMSSESAAKFLLPDVTWASDHLPHIAPCKII